MMNKLAPNKTSELKDLISLFGGVRRIHSEIGVSHTTLYKLIKHKNKKRLSEKVAVKLHKFFKKKGVMFDIGDIYPEYKGTFK